MRPSPAPPTAKVITGGRKTSHTRKLATASEGNASHAKDVAPHMKPELLQSSLVWYLAKTYVLRFSRPKLERAPEVAAALPPARQEAA